MVDPDFRDIPTGCHVIYAPFRVDIHCTDRRQIGARDGSSIRAKRASFVVSTLASPNKKKALAASAVSLTFEVDPDAQK